jgi:tRNA-splicing ligase RtcB (3'-phosphate/5'-hydroxy nucleic acid ligase)
MEPQFEVIEAGRGMVKAWKRGVPFEEKAIEQLKQSAQLPFVYKWLAAMPDCHWGMGATVGSVLPTKGAVVPAAVGVDIGCGMMAVRVNATKTSVVEKAKVSRQAIEDAVPAGRTHRGAAGDRGAWGSVPAPVMNIWTAEFDADYARLVEKHPKMLAYNTFNHLGTLGTGNHFIEVCADENDAVWVMLHSGSRGLGNKIGSYFTRVAQDLCDKWFVALPHRDLAYLPQGTPEFHDYVHALHLAQRFAWRNREIMLDNILNATGFSEADRVHCHHNYMAWEHHYGENVMVTRKGAVRAGEGEMGIIPGSMGTRSYIVRGLGSSESFCSCSHGAGRAMGRQEAKRRFTIEDHVRATEGVECHKGFEVLDETPGAYKNIDAVMEAQKDLVEIVHTLKQLVCVKGLGD